jgi:hypothetical protein
MERSKKIGTWTKNAFGLGLLFGLNERSTTHFQDWQRQQLERTFHNFRFSKFAVRALRRKGKKKTCRVELKLPFVRHSYNSSSSLLLLQMRPCLHPKKSVQIMSWMGNSPPQQSPAPSHHGSPRPFAQSMRKFITTNLRATENSCLLMIPTLLPFMVRRMRASALLMNRRSMGRN